MRTKQRPIQKEKKQRIDTNMTLIILARNEELSAVVRRRARQQSAVAEIAQAPPMNLFVLRYQEWGHIPSKTACLRDCNDIRAMVFHFRPSDGLLCTCWHLTRGPGRFSTSYPDDTAPAHDASKFLLPMSMNLA